MLLGSFLSSCRDGQNQSNGSDPTVYKTPVTKPFEYTEPKQIEWEITDPDSIAPPKTYPLDIDKLPSRPFTVNEFKPLTSPMKEYTLDYDKLEVNPLQFDTIPFTFKKSIIPEPVVKKVEMPSIVENMTTGLLQLSEGEGLPSNEIKVILENDDGTFWIATYDGGLCLYNGKEIYIYDYDEIYDIVKDKDGLLWVSTNTDGVYILDFQKNIQTQFFTSRRIMYELYCDQENNMWINHWQSGTFIMNAERTQLRKINEEFDLIMRIWEDQDQNIWIGHFGYISIIGKDRKGYRKIEDTQDYSIGMASTFFSDHQGNVWIDSRKDLRWMGIPAMSVRGLLSFSIKDKTVRSLDSENGFNGYAIKYQEDDLGRLWIFQNDTAFIMDADRTEIKTITTKGSLNTLTRLGYSMKDSRGNIWIASHNRGVILIDPAGALPEHLDKSYGLLHSEVWEMSEDSRGQIWLGTRAGINIYDPIRQEIKALTPAILKSENFRGFQGQFYPTIKEYEKDKYFIDGINGFTIIDRSINEMTRYCADQTIAVTIRDFLRDDEGKFWMATGRGFAVYTPTLNQMKFIPRFSSQFPANLARGIVDDGLGHYWVSTNRGLLVINPKENTIKYLREEQGLCDNDVMMMLLAADGQLWVATTHGISIIDIENQSITNIGEQEGLIPDETYDLVEKDGEIFIGTVNGLVRVQTPTEAKPKWEFYNFAAAKGFPSNDYNRASGLVTSNGQMWFGTGPEHKLTILTQDPTIDTTLCPIQITSISIMDEKISFNRMSDFKSALEPSDTLWYDDGQKFYLKHTLPMDSSYVFENNIRWDNVKSPHNIPSGLKLPYHQNYLRFAYSNLCVLDRDKISYRYILEGKDNQWSYSGDKAESKNYFNLQPGNYTFKVATKGMAGEWSVPAEFSFSILPPWWRTWWAYLGYALLAIGAVWSIVQYRSRRLQIENKLLEEKVKTRTHDLESAKVKVENTLENLKATQKQLIHSEKMASLGELTAGIAHEIQNPLNFVNNFSEVSTELIDEMNEELNSGDFNEAKAISTDIKQNLEKILHHGKRADSIVKGMLQHSRTNSGEKEPTDINALADEYLRLAYHGLRAKDKTFNATLETDFDERIGKVNIIPQDMGRVILNLITNAFYACNERKKVSEDADYKPTVSVSTKLHPLAPASGGKGSISPAGGGAGGGMIHITVSDNGSGIPEDIKQKIFQPFFTTKATGEGTGLGLSLSYDIVKAHGGELSCSSKVGEGTEFIIKLPVV